MRASVTVWRAIGLAVIVQLIPTASAVDCYWCEDCDSHDPAEWVQCPLDCAVWYATDEKRTTVFRGCAEFGVGYSTYQQCAADLCNSASVGHCLRCGTDESAECEDVVCPTEGDQCYINLSGATFEHTDSGNGCKLSREFVERTRFMDQLTQQDGCCRHQYHKQDGRRGCTSDVQYEFDCSPGAGPGSSCAECEPVPGQPCNDVRRCAVCDTASNPDCAQDASSVQRCGKVNDQCYRYLDESDVLHLGCTGAEDYLSNCQAPNNCHTCASDACNGGEAKFQCHVCDDCYAVDQAAGDKRECNLHETDRCYTGYAWSTKRTYRGCWREDLPSFDSFEQCDGDGCNRRDFPTHLQCYQCVGCDRIPDEGVNYCRSVEATGCFMMITDGAEQGGGKTLVRGCNTDEAYDDCREERNCVTCAEEQCNNSPRTARRLCDRCAGALECEGIVGPAASCLDTTFTNQCYLYSDGDGELTKGCLLDLDPASQVAEACYDPNDARCSICKEATCSRQHCVRCDTRTDGLACLLADKQAPLRYTLCAGACRVQIDADGNTVRGCATDFAEPCAEDSETCTETAAPGSNGGVYPLERRQCYQCEGELCLGEQQAANGQYCRLYGGNSDSCYIYNDGTVVVRGCTTDPEAKCTDNDAAYCTIQPDSLSNGAGQELAQAITCYQDCSPGGSEQIPSCPPITCPPAADRCYVSVSDSGVISRGCTSQDGGCPQGYRDCFTCKESNCNGVYAVCSECDTSIDEDCSVAEEHGAVCEQAIGCFHYQDENRAVYGCAEQAPAQCATDAEHCRTCEGVFCNEKVLNSCFSCTDCPDVLRPIQRTKVCAADGDRCATGIVGKSVVRDCLSEMPDEYLPVQDCPEWNCNEQKITECYECTDCPEIPDASDATPCINPSTDQCYTVLFNRQINRGCATTDEIAECDDGVNCAVCDDDKCNGLAIPTEFSCVRCKGASNCADYNVLSECIIGLPLLLEGCVTYTDGESVMKGCLSELDLFNSCAGGTNSEQCSVAMTPKGNARPVQCLECTAGIACVQGNPSELTVGTYEHGSCVALVNANGMVERGNALNYPAACQGPSASCHECFTDRCNEGLFPPGRLLCYQCDGAECAQLPLAAAYVPQPCLRHDPASAMCYTWYEGASDARRGCLLDDTAVCATPGVSCQSCSESGCNDLGYDAFVVTEHCVQCSTNGACERNPAEEHCSGPGGCYTFTAGSFVIAKGCVSELEESMTWYNDCASGSSSDSCRHCFGDYCNRNRCFVCNSRLDGGASCVDPVVGHTDSVVCPDSDTCVAFLDGEGHTVRGCANTYVEECAESGDTCQQCRGDHCNGRPLPGDRIKCYQCSGSADECLTPPKGSDSYCAIYREGEESCFTHFTDETTVERGCTLQREQPCVGNCQTCDATGCNDQPAMVPNPLSCVQCSGDECTDSVNPTLCPEEILFGHPDHCYTYFHPDGTKDRGCFSGLARSGSATADQCLDARDDLCKLCSPGGCNARSVQCFACDSNAHPSCAGVLSEAADDSLIKTCGTGQCVSLVEGTTTQKGCSEDYEEQCAIPDAVCETFDGALSNGETYPAQRLQCVQCSETGCDSSQLPATPSACQAYVPGDECYIYVADNGDTFRGCLSDPDANRCTEHSDHCVRCSSKSGCNTDASESSNELICAKCTSTGCEQGERYERCTRDVLLGRTDSCYVYSFNGEVLARGCLSDAEESVRDACTSGSGSGSDCSVCQCDRCNGPPVRCVDCQGKAGCGEILGQAANLAQCRTSACVSFVKYATDESSLIVKGCSEVYEQETCVKKSDNPDYELCHSTQCNDVPFPEGRLKCYQCVADACSDRSLEPTICEPYRAAGEMCYSFLDHQEKGCLGQLEDPEQCSRDEGPCRVCDASDGCNVEPRALECTVCTSKTDSSCVDPTAMAKDKKTCSVGGCTTFIDPDGHTVKGCAMDYGLTSEYCSSGAATCFICDDADSCNDVLHPPNRLQCYQCSGPGCVDIASQKPTICERYVPTDTCYVYASSATSITRGCLSDPAATCPEGCATCASANGCNTDPPIVPNSLTCHQCDGPDCASAPTEKGTKCPDVLLGRSDACYSYVEKYSTRRGCLSEERACNPADTNCHVCSDGNDCNNDAYSVDVHECIQCDETEADEACKWGFERIGAERCTGLSSFESGCYTCYTSTQAIPERLLFHRGCTGDERQTRCEPETVQVCLGAGCNNRNERLQICAKCDGECEDGRWLVEECRGTVAYERRGCYLIRDARKRIQSRGCVSDLNEDGWQRCSNVKDSSCITCLDNECNHAATGLLGRMSVICMLLVTFITLIL